MAGKCDAAERELHDFTIRFEMCYYYSGIVGIDSRENHIGVLDDQYND